MDIKDRIKELRKIQQMTQSEFGEKIFVSRSLISAYEKGIKPIPNRTIETICNSFNVNKQWLLTGEGDIYIDELEGYTTSEKSKKFVKLFLELDEEDQDFIIDATKRILKKE
ncbi:Helix-turn-helix domain protein [Clostridioides difficile]|nr:Helix-turn-helix domain protein [Clostridioides difficile]CZS09303.1 Helix-turn-helix domain protein [Clostridioides difficile]